MSWERFESDYKNGTETDLGFVTADDLRANPSIEVVVVKYRIPARIMSIREESVIYGKNNEKAKAVDYDLHKEMSPLGDNSVLNVYGAAMLRDYLQFNYLGDK